MTSATTWTQPEGQGIAKVRQALADGDWEQIKTAVTLAKFAVRPTALSLDELAANWEYQPMPDTWTDTVQAALFTGDLTMEQYQELSGLAGFTGPEPSRIPGTERRAGESDAAVIRPVEGEKEATK